MSVKLTAIFVILLIVESSLACSRIPKNIPHGKRRQGDNGYRIVIGDYPTEYQPGKVYNLFLLGSRTHGNLQQYTHFTLNAQASTTDVKDTAALSIASPKRVGRFQLFSDALTKFNEECVNTISEADDLPKTEIQVMWVAPRTGSGCVALSAMVYENSKAWFADDGELTKIICESTEKPKVDETACCACDEAKYSFVFEGIWSNETHPRDYPFAIWLTHFSDVIGASHDGNFSFWGENHIATDGFRSLAEWGSVRALETELRAKGPRLRTLIKAAGLWYPNVNTNTSSNFRVDRTHHKLSLVSMFGPSPDWVVGVSGLNLCRKDCSWEDSFDVDLYPWDSGTDNGITYMSPNSETQPRERMYRITTMYPEDPRQPFYNDKSSQMTPLARLYIRKEKTIPRNCDQQFLEAQVLDVSENTEEGASRSECDVTEFTEWTPCSVTCGKGIRMRNRYYRNEAIATASKCNRQLVNKEMCVADVPECDGDSKDEHEENLAQSVANVNDAGEGVGVCRTTGWQEWSPCSATCGIGISMRTRTFVNHAGRKKCPHISVVEKEKCMKPECILGEMEIPDAMCPVTIWSDWSPCSTTCGRGVRIRTRILLIDDAETIATCSKRLVLHEQQQCTDRPTCLVDTETAREICVLKPEIGPCRGVYNRFAYDAVQQKCISFVYGGCRGNQNNFLTEDECSQTCARVSNSISRSSTASTPRLNRFHSQPAPVTVDYSRSTLSTVTTESPDNRTHTPSEQRVDCVLSAWSAWSECSVSCGGGVQERSRFAIRSARFGGSPCSTRTSTRRRCNVVAC